MEYPQLTARVALIVIMATPVEASAPQQDGEALSPPAASQPSLHDPARLALQKGWEAYQRGDLAHAVAAYQEAMAMAPGDASVWYDLGCLYALQGEFDRARSALRQTLELEARFAPAHDALGQLDEREGQRYQAKEAYATAHQLEPDNPRFLNHLVRVLLDLGKLDEARDGLGRLLAIVPGDLTARYRLAILELRTGAPDLALNNFLRIVEARPDDIMAWNGLGLAYAHIGQHQQALEALERAKQLEPANVRTLTNLGIVAAYQQHWDEARAAWQSSLQLEPGFAPAAQNLNTLNALTDSRAP